MKRLEANSQVLELKLDLKVKLIGAVVVLRQYALFSHKSTHKNPIEPILAPFES